MYRWKIEEEKSYQDAMGKNNVSITAKGGGQLVSQFSNFLGPTQVTVAHSDNPTRERDLRIEVVKDDLDLLRAKFIQSSSNFKFYNI